MELWYNKPACEWTQALPLGNGRIGAMVYGDPQEETLWLNEDTFWSGYPRQLVCEDKASSFLEVRDLVRRGRQKDAQALFEQELSFPAGESYEPLGTLHLRFDHAEQVSHYRRSLNLSEAIAYVDYHVGETAFHREMLISHPHQVLALRLVRVFITDLTYTNKTPAETHIFRLVDAISEQQRSCCFFAVIWYTDDRSTKGAAAKK